MTSHKPLDYRNAMPGEQWKVWVPFHFLPGNDPRANTFTERMVTLPDSEPTKRMLAETLDAKNKSYWPYLIGIAAHVYADTFSHFGFVGFASEWNLVNNDDIQIKNVKKRSGIYKYIKGKLDEFASRVMGTMAEIIPIGHGAVATLPDRPYLEWSFRYQTHLGKPDFKTRHNTDSFMHACQKLHKYFGDYAKRAGDGVKADPSKNWNDIKEPVRALLKSTKPVDERIIAWKKAIARGVFCKATEIDKTIKYDEIKWAPGNVRHEIEVGQKIRDTEACGYIRAAWRHRNYVLHELLPGFDLVAY